MSTYREMTYMVLDALKLIHDDAYYTEEHVVFLLDKMRSLLLMRKYSNGRNEISSSNYQELCLDMSEAELVPGVCMTGGLIRSDAEVPDLLFGETRTQVYPVNILLGEKVTFIPAERMPFVGYNKWLKDIIYVAIGKDHHLYARSANAQFRYLRQLKLNGVFEDSSKAAELSCAGNGSDCDTCIDVLDMEFPLEDALQAACIEYVVNELSGARFAPQDKANNAEDDLSKARLTDAKAPSTAIKETNNN